MSYRDVSKQCWSIFNQQCHISENLTILKAIFNVIDKRQDNVFVFDRGGSERNTFCKLDESDCRFVTRQKNNTRIKVIEERETETETKVGNLTIVQDQLVYLYKSGTKIVEHPFRLIRAKNDNDAQYLFLSNMHDVPATDIIQIYKKRWDIEVFFTLSNKS